MYRTLAALALTACAGSFAAPVLASDIALPARKAGEWQMTITVAAKTKMPPMSMTICLDDKTDRAMMESGLALSKETCSRQDMSRDGDALVIDSVCQNGAMKTTSHIVITGDFQSAYTMAIDSTMEGGPAKMPKASKITQEARWLGATCSGLKPGEMLMPNGMKINAAKTLKAVGG